MTTFGKYQVTDLIGEGGFGKVYRGQDPVLKRPVAIKTCTLQGGDVRERFAREAEIAGSLRHPNILTVYDFGEQDGEPYLVQEYLPGEDLDEKIRRADLVPLATKVEWLRQIALGLRFAHDNGVVHRDVKPANVRILPDGQVRIMDFGIAKLLQADRQLTQMGFSVGTTGYLAPEQLRGEEVDHRADIFSFGVLAYELITYRRPFEAETITAILYRIAHEEPQPLVEAVPGCSPRLADTIERCLRKRPDERWSDLAPVVDELEAVQREIGAIGAAAAQVGATRAFEVVTGSGPKRAVDATPAAPPHFASSASPAAAGPASAPHTGQGRPSWWRRSPAMAGLAVATLAVALFGVLNVAQWAASAEPDDELTAATDESAGAAGPADAAQPAGVAEPEGQADASVRTPPTSAPVGGGVAAGDAGRSGAGSAGGAEAAPPPDAGGGVARAPVPPRQRSADDITPPAAALPAGHVLVLVGGGPESARGIAESTLVAELLAAGLAPVEDATAAQMGQQARDIRGLGQRHATGTVLMADLRAQAVPGVGRFFTGTATLTLRAYDANTGALLGTQSFQVGAGGVPGKSGATEDAAMSDAARAVAYQAARFAASLIERRGGGPAPVAPR